MASFFGGQISINFAPRADDDWNWGSFFRVSQIYREKTKRGKLEMADEKREFCETERAKIDSNFISSFFISPVKKGQNEGITEELSLELFR